MFYDWMWYLEIYTFDFSVEKWIVGLLKHVEIGDFTKIVDEMYNFRAQLRYRPISRNMSKLYERKENLTPSNHLSFENWMSVFFSLQVSSISLRKLIAAESERKKNDNRPNALINTTERKYWYKVLSPLGWRKKKSVRLKWHTIYSYELIYMTIICTHKIEANQIGQSIK